MYFARGIRDLLQTTQLNIEFFENLDEFQLHFIEMCFKQSVDSKMGLMTEVEAYNLHLFEEYKLRQLENLYSLEQDHFDKVA